MRILLINYEFPPLGGGAGVASFEIAKGLSALGHSLEIITSGFSGLSSSENTFGFRIHRLPVGRRRLFAAFPLELLRFGFKAHQFIAKLPGPFDVVLSFFAVPSGVAGARAAKRFNCPHVVCLRGMDVPGFDRQSLRHFHRILRPTILGIWRRADLLVTPSAYLRDLATAQFSGCPISVIPNGFTPKNIQSLDRSYAAKLLMVGRLVHQKNHMALLNILRNFLDQAWQLDLVGDGPLLTEIRAFIKRYHLENRIRLHGWQPHANVEKFYQQADLLIHPSVDEGMSNVVLESLSHGLPILASSAGGTRETVRHLENGMLFDPNNPEELKQALRLFFAMNQQQRTNLRMGTQRGLTRQTWQHIARLYEKQLFGLMKPSPDLFALDESACIHAAEPKNSTARHY